ncbi:MAG: AraC family transcriptional regulator [Kiritimatiellae bacterium]|jgi:AraC-like DNA-binding protein|nr:AraC family transcriptional regulator [Kiritimatiellia bacterium]
MTVTIPTKREPSIHEWSSLRTELLWIYQGQVKQYDLERTVRHEYGYWLWLILHGGVDVQSASGDLHAIRGQWILCPKGESSQRFTEDAEILSLHFLCQWPTGENLFTEKEGLVFESVNFPELKNKASALQQLVEQSFPGSWAMLFQQPSGIESFLNLQAYFPGFLLEWVRTLRSFNRHPAYSRTMDDRVGVAIRCLNGCMLSEPFPEDQLMRESGVSRVHLDRMLTTQIGMTSREYWEKRREEAACYHLESTNESIKEIGYNLGFKQASHFTNWFKRRKNLPPVAYRRKEARARLSE